MNKNALLQKTYIVIRMAAALMLSVLLGGTVFAIAGFDPIQTYGYIIRGAFGSYDAILTTIQNATPLLFTGLAFAIAQKVGILNLGGEGQLYIGAMAAALAGAYLPAMPTVIEIPFLLVLAASAAGLYGALVGVLKTRFGTNEVIVTLMLTYIAQLFCEYLVAYPLKDPQGIPRTARIAASAQLGKLVEGNILSSAVCIAIAAVLLGWAFLKYTRLGYRIKAVGINRLAAESAGIDSKKMIVLAMFISGAVAGLCGATQVMGTYYRFLDDFSPGYGFQGIAVSALAANNPIMLVFSAILWGGLKAGASEVNRIASVPMDIIIILQALVVVLVASKRVMDLLLKPLKLLLVKEKSE